MLALAYLRPAEGQSIWSKRRQGFQPCFEAGIRELPFLMPEPAEKPSLFGRILLCVYVGGQQGCELCELGERLCVYTYMCTRECLCACLCVSVPTAGSLTL